MRKTTTLIKNADVVVTMDAKRAELKGASIDSNLQNQQILPRQRSLTKDFIVVYN